MLIINSIEGYPQFSYYSTSTELDDITQYDLFEYIIQSNNGTAEILALFLKDILKITHFGIIYTNDSYSLGYVQSLQSAIVKLAPKMKMY